MAKVPSQARFIDFSDLYAHQDDPLLMEDNIFYADLENLVGLAKIFGMRFA